MLGLTSFHLCLLPVYDLIEDFACCHSRKDVFRSTCNFRIGYNQQQGKTGSPVGTFSRPFNSYNDLKDEQKSHVRGGIGLSYDQE